MTAPPVPQLRFTEDGRKIYEPDGPMLCRLFTDRAADGSRAPVMVMRGPIGSGKTLGMFNLLWQIACGQDKSPLDGMRKTRWGVIRNTYPDLEGTTVKDWVEWFPEDHYGTMYWSRPLEYHMAIGDVRCEVVFMALDRPEDVKKLRSGQFTGFYFNELQYIPREIFTEARSRTNRYPSPADGFATWAGVLADMNEPSEDHWLVQMTGEVPFPEDMPIEERARLTWPKEWRYYVQPPALLEVLGPDGKTVRGYRINPVAENLRWLKPNYYPELVRGNDKRWVDSRLMNRISVWVDGKPVWTHFREETHVAREPLSAVRGVKIRVGLDFGRNPAAIFGQYVGNRWYILDELVAYDVDTVIFAPMVKRRLEEHFPGHDVEFWGDPKGADKGQGVGRTPYDIYESHQMHVRPAPCDDNDIPIRVNAVTYVLTGLHDGAPRILLCPVHCRTLKVAMAGKYHYKLIRGSGGYEEKPHKDKYSNPADALQYLILGGGEGRDMVGRPRQGSAKPVSSIRHRGARRRVA